MVFPPRKRPRVGRKKIVLPEPRETLGFPLVKPLLNTEEKIGKTVGRRVAPRDAFRFGMEMQKTAIELERAMGRSLCPKGVFRFRTHEEADEWMLKMLARRAK